MKFSLKTEIFPVVCIVAMFVLAAVAWPHAPEIIPIHWGLDGQPDNYAGRFFGLLGAPLIAVGVYGLFFILPLVDPRRTNYDKFWGRYLFIRNLVVVLLLCIKVITFLWVMDVGIDMGMSVFIVVGLLFVLLGNYMAKLRPTWFVGIRSPWTLSSEESWNKTHRLGGRMFVLLGLLMIAAGIARETWVYITAGVFFAVMLVYLYIYSYLVWKKDPDAVSLTTRLSGRKRGG